MSESPSSYERAQSIAASLATVDCVVALDGGTAGQVATFGRGHRIEGVRVSKDITTVRVVIPMGVPITEVDRSIRAHLSKQAERLDIQIADVVEVKP